MGINLDLKELPGVYSSEEDQTVQAPNIPSANQVGYAGAFEKGYIGVAVDFTNTPDFTRVYGEGEETTFTNNWHAVDLMLLNSTVAVSRAFNEGTTKSAYFNLDEITSEYRTTLVTDGTALEDMDTVTGLIFQPAGTSVGEHAVTFVKQEINEFGFLEVTVSYPPAYVGCVDNTSNIVFTGGGTHLCTAHTDLERTQTKKYTIPEPAFSKSDGDKFYLDVSGLKNDDFADMIESERMGFVRYDQGTLACDLSLTHESIPSTPGTSKIFQFTSADVFVGSWVLSSVTSVGNQDVSYQMSYQSSGKYGVATDIYDINDDEFGANIKSNLSTREIFAVANTPGKWANGVRVRMYGQTAVAADSDLQKLINFTTLADHEILLIISQGAVSEQFVVSSTTTEKDADNQYYNIEDVTKTNSELVTIFLNVSDTNTEDYDYDFLLVDGADGDIDASDVALAYEVFADEKYETSLIVTGNGKYISSDLDTINQSVSSKVCDKVIDRFGLFTVPLSVIKVADPKSQVISWFESGGFKITSQYHKYEIQGSHFYVSNKYGGQDITLPQSVIVVANLTQTADSVGRHKAVIGTARGVIGGFKKPLWTPTAEEADELYIRRINSVIYQRGTGFVKMGQKTNLPTQSKSNRTNVRWYQNEVESQLDQMATAFVGENSDKVTWDRLKSSFDKALQRRKDNNELNDFEVKCDAENNPPSVQALNEIVVEVVLDYKVAGEKIRLKFISKTIAS